MKKCRKCQLLKELSEFGRDRCQVDGYYPSCKTCKKKYQARYLAENKEKVSVSGKAYREKNKEHRCAVSRARYASNKERLLEKSRSYYEQNKTTIRARESERYTRTRDSHLATKKAFRLANPAIINARNNKRRTEQMKRTPKWLTAEDFDFMEMFYQLAKGMEIATGVKHHVDHIFPLQGEFVSGLHVPSNLQILTAAENIRKGNRWLPE